MKYRIEVSEVHEDEGVDVGCYQQTIDSLDVAALVSFLNQKPKVKRVRKPKADGQMKLPT